MLRLQLSFWLHMELWEKYGLMGNISVYPYKLIFHFPTNKAHLLLDEMGSQGAGRRVQRGCSWELHRLMGVRSEGSPQVATGGIPVLLGAPVAARRFSAPPDALLPASSVVPNAGCQVGDEECLKNSDAESTVISFSLCSQGHNCLWKKSCK